MLKKITLLFAVLSCIVDESFSQSASDTVLQHMDSIRISPNRQYVSAQSLGNYTSTTYDLIGLQTNAGFDVRNTLRGHVANFNVGSNAAAFSGGLRNANQMLIIDGVPYSNIISSFYNLNSFEFGSVSSISSGNGLALYGGVGANGAILLESKNGKDITKPQFEANSFITFASTPKYSSDFIETEQVDQWMFTHSAAYAQDFGAVDTRVSYTNTYLPDASSDPNTASGMHALKINTGFELSPRFTARVIADGIYQKLIANYSYPNSDAEYEYEADNRSLFGNLFLNYKATDWLNLSSQSGYTKSIENTDTKFSSEYTSYSSNYNNDQKRAFTNLWATFTPRMNSKISLSYATGAQLERLLVDQKYEESSTNSSNGMYIGGTGKTRTWLNQLNLNLYNYFFIELDYRQDYFKDAADNINDQPTYSANAAFNFRDAFKITSSGFNGGTIRGSIGKTNALEVNSYPLENKVNPDITWGNVIPNPNLRPTKRTSSEIGTDLVFVDSRLSLHATYFHNKDNQTIENIRTYFGNGYVYVATDIGKLKTKGWELALAAVPYKQNASILTTKFIFASYKSRVKPNESRYKPYTNLNPYLPDWTSSILTQFTSNQIFAQVLITHQYGGEYTYYDFANSTIHKINYSQSWVRDISIGYNFEKLSLSLSGRNLIKLYQKEDKYENEINYMTQKTVSLSATLRL